MSLDCIVAKKIGMTRIFDDHGRDYPVTVLEAGPCFITQIKNEDLEGYNSVQLGFLDKSNRKLRKPEVGHLSKSGVSGKRVLKEFKCDLLEGLEVGQEVNTSIFEVGDLVAVSGISKGKGFAGHMKRHNFGGGRASHGKNSVMRKAGSVGAGTSPGRVWKGTRMAGRMGGESVSVKNLSITKIDSDKNLIFVRGAVPGSKNGIVYIKKK